MPFALITIGLLMIITGINNTYSQFATQLSTDMFGGGGQKGFVPWLLAIGTVGALGYIDSLRQFSHYFLALILISLVLSNKGVFANLQTALNAGPTTPTAVTQNGGSTIGDNTKNAATGDNPGSNLIGQITAPASNTVRSWFGLPAIK